jgi:hypothetical protein
MLSSPRPVAKEKNKTKKKEKVSADGSSAVAASQPKRRTEKVASGTAEGVAPPIATLATDYFTKLPGRLGSGVVADGSPSEKGGEVSESSTSTTTTTTTTTTIGFHEAHKYMTSCVRSPRSMSALCTNQRHHVPAPLSSIIKPNSI